MRDDSLEDISVPGNHDISGPEPIHREKLIEVVSVLLARHDYRFGLGGKNEIEYGYRQSHMFEKRAAEVVDAIIAQEVFR